MITIARIDERLIHGQVSYAWTTAYKSEAVMAVDAEAARDQMQVSLLKMACPAGLKCFVADEERAAALLAKYERRRIFVVAKHPDAYLRMVELGAHIDEINVGGLYFKEGRRQVSRTVYVDEHMEETFRALAEKGVRLEVRTHPRDSSEDLMALL
ncbi:PTS system mannose/fructose/N-acetylgalactosamine-transporter subunit IIB [Thermophilibacter sp.]